MIMSVHGLKPDLPERRRDRPRPRPRGDDGRGERAARPRRHPDHVSDAQGMGRAGETVRRTFQLASVLKPARRRQPARQRPRAALPREAHDQPGARARPRRTRSARCSRAGWPTSCSGAGVLRRQALPRAQVRPARLGHGRRPERGRRRRRAAPDRRAVRRHRGSGRRPRGACSPTVPPSTPGRDVFPTRRRRVAVRGLPRRRARADGPAPASAPAWSSTRAAASVRPRRRAAARWTRSSRCRSAGSTSSDGLPRAGERVSDGGSTPSATRTALVSVSTNSSSTSASRTSRRCSSAPASTS